MILQIALIAWLIYVVYNRFRGTQAERVLRGLILLSPIVLVCYTLKLAIITKLIEVFSPTILVGLIVIFAPEFRRVLMQLGGNLSMDDYLHIAESKKTINESIEEIIAALESLQRNRFGALIAIEKAAVERYYINPGKTLNATLSKELLLTIFNPKTPLHDGAVTIKGFTVVAAGVILPMTENPKLDWQYGTRHRAAIGFTEVTESLCLVVSEETGELSIAEQGRLTNHISMEPVRKRIQEFYSQILKTEKKHSTAAKYLNSFFASIRPAKSSHGEDEHQEEEV